MMGAPVPCGAATDAKSDPSSRRPLPSSSLSLPSSSLSLEEELSLSEELSTQHRARVPRSPKTLTERRSPSINLKWRVNPSIKLWIRANVFHPRPRYITPGAGDSTWTRAPLIPQPLMRSLSVSGCSASITLAKGVGRRRRRRGARRSLMKNSRGSSQMWPAVRRGAAGGGEAGASPRPPRPRAPRPCPRPRPRPRPLPLPLTAGSAATGARGGGARCLAATLAATEEGPGFPPSIVDGRRKPEAEEERRWSADFRCPRPLLIKGRSGGSAAPLSQSKRRKGRRRGPPPHFDPHRPGPLPPPPRPQVLGDHVAGAQSRSDGRGDPSPPRDRG